MDELLKFIKTNNMNIKSFAKQAGVPWPSMYRIARGRCIPSPDNMAKIKEATNGKITADDFYMSKARKQD